MRTAGSPPAARRTLRSSNVYSTIPTMRSRRRNRLAASTSISTASGTCRISRPSCRATLRAIAIGKALLAAGIVERLDEPDETGRRYRLTMDLQLDFALDQPLSPLALAALDILDRQADGYALDAISLIEATLEGPRPVLSAQRFKARGEAVAAMKADGTVKKILAKWGLE